MDAIEAIMTRRSIRKFKSTTVTQEQIDTIIAAGMSAPSAGNEQPWHFVVINDRGILNEIPRCHPYSAMLKEAPVAIVVCGDLKLEKHEGFWIQDCSAAAQNMLLAIHALGLGAVWLGVYPRDTRVKGISRLLKLPENVVPLAIMPIGGPGEQKPRQDRFNRKRVHYNEW